MPKIWVLQRAWLWAPPLAYMALIYHLSAESDPLPLLTEHLWDKVLHFTEYSTLGFLLYRAVAGEGLSLTPAVLFTLVTTSVYGATDEFHQFFTPGRSSDIHDWIADTLGGAVGIAAYAVVVIVFSTLSRRRHRLRRLRPDQ